MGRCVKNHWLNDEMERFLSYILKELSVYDQAVYLLIYNSGVSRILEKGGPNFPLAQTLFFICSKLLKKLHDGGGGTLTLFWGKRQLRQDL